MSYTLHHGDCIEVLGMMPDNSADAIIADPPFAFAGGYSNGMASMTDSQFFAYWWKDVCHELQRVLRPEGEGFIWCDWRSAMVIAEGFYQKQKYTWRLASMLYHYREMPGMGQPFRSSVDMIAYVRGPKSKGSRISNTTHNFISQYWYYGKHPYHPAEKSVEMCERLLGWCSDPGMAIIDPFMGSGTTGVACLKAKRHFVGIEHNADYFEIANKRLSAEENRPEQISLLPIAGEVDCVRP